MKGHAEHWSAVRLLYDRRTGQRAVHRKALRRTRPAADVTHGAHDIAVEHRLAGVFAPLGSDGDRARVKTDEPDICGLPPRRTGVHDESHPAARDLARADAGLAEGR